LACAGEQRERYLLPTVRGDRTECLAMTEPGAGSDLRGMKTSAVASGDDFVINGTKHFISHADHSDYVILFAATGEEASAAGTRKKMTAFLIDMGHPGFEVRAGYKNVSHRGYTNSILEFNDCRVPKSAILGELHRGFDVANTWLGCDTRCRWPPPVWAAPSARSSCRSSGRGSVQFGQQIGKFQGVSFKLADMAVELRAAELLTLEAAWKRDQKIDTDMDMAIAKVKATEMLAMVADEALADSWRHGADERPAVGAHLARRAYRAHLGRHQRNPATYHFAEPAPASGGIVTQGTRWRQRRSAVGRNSRADSEVAGG
jgi:acyl-CoA dehydrogenase